MEQREELIEALGDAQRLGFLGARPVEETIAHAESFVEALATTSGIVVDLGAGGGVPGLVIAASRPDLEVVLVDRRTKRTDFLTRTVRRLGWSGRVVVRPVDTERLCRDEPGSFDAAVARGFGPPDVTLRTGRDLVRPGGVIVISEPPSGDRWSPHLLEHLTVSTLPGPGGVACFRRRPVDEAPDGYRVEQDDGPPTE